MGGCCSKEDPQKEALLANQYGNHTSPLGSSAAQAPATSPTYEPVQNPVTRNVAIPGALPVAAPRQQAMDVVPSMASSIPATSAAAVPAPEPSLLMRQVHVDPAQLQAVVTAADEDFLEVDRSVENVEREDPASEENMHMVHALRSVAVAPEPVRLGEIPRSAIVSREAAVSALAAEALPHDIARTIHALSGRLAQMVDTVAVRHNDAPIVMFFPSSTKKV